MPKQPLKAEVNSFVKGLISEASPLNFPPNASLDEENFELNRDGTRNRRLGFDTPYGVGSYPSTENGTLLSNQHPPGLFKWTDAGGIPGLNYLVVQYSRYIEILDLSNILSDALTTKVHIDLTEVPASTDRYSLTSVDGRLVIATGNRVVFVITRESNGTFTKTIGYIKTRDVWGVESSSGYENDPRIRSGYDPLHIYNLRNQSWGMLRKNVANAMQDPINIYVAKYGVYPSNTETVWPGLQFQPVTSGTPYERVYPELYEEVLGGDTKAPKGYFIIDALQRGQSRKDEVAANLARANNGLVYNDTSVIKTDYTYGGATQVAEFAGRVFYGGFNGSVTGGDKRSPNFSNYVFFSQLVKSPGDFFKCHSEGDPTSRDNSDIVDSDGGFIRIAGADKIIKMVNMASSLLIICTNGIWTISGGSDFGFSATNYKVDKISTFGGLSATSVILEKNRAFYWAREGIYVIGRSTAGDFVCESLTDTTIQKLYQNISVDARVGARGEYDPINKKLKWIYDSDTGNSTIELVFDLVLNSFYRHRIMDLNSTQVGSRSTKVVGIFSSSVFKQSNNVDTVYVDNSQVLNSSEVVIVDRGDSYSEYSSILYLVHTNQLGVSTYTFGLYTNQNFRDWELNDIFGSGIDAKGFMLTGHQIAGDSSIKKQMQYLTMHFKRTTTPLSSCFTRMQWDWSGASNSNKWSALRQSVRETKPIAAREGFDVITTKNLIRGSGRALALYIETEEYKDCNLLGWSVSTDTSPRV